MSNKNRIEAASQLKGQRVVSREEGEWLGTVSAIHVDPEAATLSAICFEPRKRLARGARFVPMEGVELIGRDAVFIRSEQVVDHQVPPPGRSIDDLQGLRVTTLKGRRVGTLRDMNFLPDVWTVCELRMTDGRRIIVTPDDVTLGVDEVLVSAVSAERMEPQNGTSDGILSRMFGPSNFEEITMALKRALKSSFQGNGSRVRRG